MKTSQAGIARLEQREGVRLSMYRDSAGLPTIGVGHFLTRDELTSGKFFFADGVDDWTDGITQVHVEKLLEQDLATAEAAINRAVRVLLTQTQFDTLVSFVFNVGATAFTQPTRTPKPGSTLLQAINAGDLAAVPAQLARWVYAGNRRDPILIKRREDEVEQWNGN